MRFSAILAAIVAPALVSAVTVSYDTVYDNASGSLTTVACSDGENGLINKGYTTFGSLPGFANIGGAAAIGGWNSTSCGTCWKLTYKGTSINVLAIDHTDDGFNLSKAALNKLTNGQAEALGRINATAVQVAASDCGLKA